MATCPHVRVCVRVCVLSPVRLQGCPSAPQFLRSPNVLPAFEPPQQECGGGVGVGLGLGVGVCARAKREQEVAALGERALGGGNVL
eukprot:2142137-Pleurochrysis_carterae.AAC.1